MTVVVDSEAELGGHVECLVVAAFCLSAGAALMRKIDQQGAHMQREPAVGEEPRVRAPRDRTVLARPAHTDCGARAAAGGPIHSQ